jgi:dipeptidyl aminopeptidase/acylaminoacyl peptidase
MGRWTSEATAKFTGMSVPTDALRYRWPGEHTLREVLMFKRAVVLVVGAVCMAPALTAQREPSAPSAGVTLEQIMANPDWIGNPPEDAYWGDDNKTIYYSQKRAGSELRDLYAVDVAGGAARKVPDSELAVASGRDGIFNGAGTLHAFVRDNNVFVRDVRTGTLRQLTRHPGAKSDPSFMAGGSRVQWHEGDEIYIADLATGLIALAADVRLADDPAASQPSKDYLESEQLRLFETLRTKDANAQARREQQSAQAAADSTSSPRPFYLGDKLSIAATSLSPDGRWFMLVTQPKSYDPGTHGAMPNYVTKSGYAELLQRHEYVGRNPPAPRQVTILDLHAHTTFNLDLTALPGIKNDPLAPLRPKAVEWDVQHGIARDAAERSVKAPDVREVSVNGMAWTDDGQQLAIEFRANDNKDRWIARVDFEKKTLVTENRLTDPAWINWDYNDFGWLHDNHTLWYLSEADNHSHLYVKDLGAGARQLTRGDFAVSDPTLTRDDRAFFVVANKPAPGTYEVYRVDVTTGAMEAVTNMGGLNGAQPALEGGESYALSPDQSALLVYHSESLRPPEVYVVGARPNPGAARAVTHTVSSAFTSIGWIAPQIVAVPSSHVKEPIYARFYAPRGASPGVSRPAVVFIHGAGYLQDAHNGWSYYFHEMMFHTFLVQHGYLVLDMDYRGSAGYGRGWRTAIYEHMGHSEVEDVVDGVHWLEQRWRVDPKRLGVYGGSYGGFMTYMMMFREPDLFAAGAALRPVGAWADYNDSYTSDILNRPEIDPQAYDDSSPIHYAEHLKHHLLILQGMEDDNVFFIDTVHMTQKLMELKNPNFDVMFYPSQRHDFTDPVAWLDEYRRIWRLFETYVSPAAPARR